jgi:uncharacterized protein DUF4402
MQTAKRLALVALFVLAGSTVLQAQTNNASINVTATVQQPINVTGANTLAFGNVLPGVNSTVGVASASAGRFDVTGQASTPVSLSFVLPASLTDGTNLLPIGTWTGNHNTTNAPTGTAFTPANAPSTFAATLSGTGTLFVFIGATVTPAVNQPAGAYAGTIQMTVVY